MNSADTVSAFRASEPTKAGGMKKSLTAPKITANFSKTSAQRTRPNVMLRKPSA